MPRVDYYRRLAPFTAKELIEAANSLLRGREELALTERTLRYYIAEKVLPPPEGPPKLARYTFSHLVGLIAIRGLQDRGISLERVRDELAPLWTGDDKTLQAVIGVLDVWLAGEARSLQQDSFTAAFGPSMLVHEPPAAHVPPPSVSYSRRRSQEDEVLATLQDVRRKLEQQGVQATAMSPSVGPDFQTVELVREAVRRESYSVREEVNALQSVLHRLADAVQGLREEIKELKRSRAAESEPQDEET